MDGWSGRAALPAQQARPRVEARAEADEGDELAALIDEVLTETGASSKKDMGRVMGALTKATDGNFDKAAAAKELGGRLA